MHVSNLIHGRLTWFVILSCPAAMGKNASTPKPKPKPKSVTKGAAAKTTAATPAKKAKTAKPKAGSKSLSPAEHVVEGDTRIWERYRTSKPPIMEPLIVGGSSKTAATSSIAALQQQPEGCGRQDMHDDTKAEAALIVSVAENESISGNLMNVLPEDEEAEMLTALADALLEGEGQFESDGPDSAAGESRSRDCISKDLNSIQ